MLASRPYFAHKDDWTQTFIFVKTFKYLARGKLDPKKKPPDIGSPPITIQNIFDVLRGDYVEKDSLTFSSGSKDKLQADTSMEEEEFHDLLYSFVEEFVPLSQ